jgi:hypothetical protein
MFIYTICNDFGAEIRFLIHPLNVTKIIDRQIAINPPKPDSDDRKIEYHYTRHLDQ